MKSIKNNTIVENPAFVRRLIEISDSDKPAELSRKYGISNQGAVNYLAGRLPEAKVLITIVEKTQCSLNWLLTGEGEKYVNQNRQLNLDETFRAIVRDIVQEEINFEKRKTEQRLSPERIAVLERFIESENTNDNLTPETRKALKKFAAEILQISLSLEDQFLVKNFGKVNQESLKSEKEKREAA